jgi:RNA polymerase sigma-70 factor (ECF subfamily)
VLNSIAGAAASPSRIAVAKETLGRIELALREMPGDLKEIILLSRLMGFSHAEIAARLGKTEGSVRTALCRGLAKIAHILAE